MTSGKLLAIDPGKSTGWAVFSLDKLDPEHHGIERGIDDFIKLLVRFTNASSLRAIVCEDFILRPYTNQTGSRMEAPQAIGAMKLYAAQQQVPIHTQPSSILPIAQRWSPDHRMPKNHDNSHDVAAILHGRYWLINNKYCRIPSQGRLLPGEVL